MRFAGTGRLPGGRRPEWRRSARPLTGSLPSRCHGQFQPGVGRCLWRPRTRTVSTALLLLALAGCAVVGSPSGGQLPGPGTPSQAPQSTLTVPADTAPAQGPPLYNLTLRAQPSATSEHVPELVPGRGLVHYTADRGIDRNPGSAWIEGVPGPGVNEQLTLTFPQAVVLTELGLIIGLDRDEAIFRANNRLRQAQLLFSNGSVLNVEFEDRRGLHYVKFDNMTTTRLTIKIVAVYPGSRYDDTAIAEVEVWGYLAP